LEPRERRQAIADMSVLREIYPKLDMPAELIRQFATHPEAPSDCVFALTTETLSADLKTKITPCQFGGNPDCKACGCICSDGLVGHRGPQICRHPSVGAIFRTSINIGRRWSNWNAERECAPRRTPDFAVTDAREM
jgi:hypothetical protein